MPEAVQMADEILGRFRDVGVAYSISGQRYEFIKNFPKGVRILRETGVPWDIDKQHLIAAIEAIRENPHIYDAGPAALRQYINNRAQSVIWALIHLFPLDVILWRY